MTKIKFDAEVHWDGCGRTSIVIPPDKTKVFKGAWEAKVHVTLVPFGLKFTPPKETPCPE